MSLQRKLVSQFHNPQGMFGSVAGWVMATRESNLARNRWTVDLLDLQPDDRVLELGPGPGVTLKLILDQVSTGSVVGVDHSATMLAQCQRANRHALNAGRLALVQADLTRLPDLSSPFSKILAVNSLQFDGMSVEALAKIIDTLRPGGTMAITFQPRGKSPSDEKAAEFGQRIATLVADAGLRDVRIETLPLMPVNAICVLGVKPT